MQSRPDLRRGAARGEAGSEDMKDLEKIMKDYHELVEYGRCEVYKIEG